MKFRSLAAVLLLTTGAAHGQLKPPADMVNPPARPPATPAAPAAPATPATPAAPAAVPADPETEAKQQAAAKVAAEWLKLIDSADYGKAWDQCAPLFREKVTRQQWTEGVPKNRAEYGQFKSRKFGGAAYRKSMPGAPEGDYVTVRFVSEYEKNPAAEELVTLTYQAGAWRPLGYLLR